MSCQRSPDSCFENSSWTQYDVTVDYVRTHPILTFFAFFKFLSLFHLAVLGSVSSSLTRSIDNAVVAVLLTVALASLLVMVVGLLVFSLVKLMGSAVVDLPVLEFSSIVEILSLPFHSHHLFQQ